MPGKKSTDQKTPAGNAKVTRNADKGDWRKELRELRKVLREMIHSRANKLFLITTPFGDYSEAAPTQAR